MWRLMVCWFLVAGIALAEDCQRPVIAAPTVPPYAYTDPQGQRQGRAIDFAKAQLSPLFEQMTIAEELPFARMFFDFERGEIDILAFELILEHKKNRGRFTQAWGAMPFGIMTTVQSSFEWQGVESLANLKGGYIIGAPFIEPYLKHFKDNPHTTELVDSTALLRMLKAERFDYIFVAIEPINQKIRNMAEFSTTEFRVHQRSIVEIPYSVQVSYNSPCIDRFNEINAAVARP